MTVLISERSNSVSSTPLFTQNKQLTKTLWPNLVSEKMALHITSSPLSTMSESPSIGKHFKPREVATALYKYYSSISRLRTTSADWKQFIGNKLTCLTREEHTFLMNSSQ